MNRGLPELPGGPKHSRLGEWRKTPPRACIWSRGTLTHIPSQCHSACSLTQIVNAKLHLKAVLGGPVRAPHHSRVVDQDVNMLLLWKTGVRTNRTQFPHL